MDTATHAVPLVPRVHSLPNGTVTARPHATQWPGSHAAHSPYRWGALATVALLVVALGGTFVAFGWPRGDENNRLANLATPGDSEPEIGQVIDPADCRASPRSIDDVLAMWYPTNESGTPIPIQPTAGLRTTVPVPLGEPADPQTIEQIRSILPQAFACFSAEDPLRSFAFYSDDLTRRYGPDVELPVDDARAFLEASPIPPAADERFRLLAVTDVSVMADGRIGAFIVFNFSSQSPDQAKTMLFILVEERGRWVFDEFVEFSGVE